MKTLYCFIFICWFQVCKGQNLVPNPSFETMITCPPNISSACNLFNDVLGASCAYWHNVGCCSADYFNACNIGSVGVPYNNFGYQNARSGNAYLGLINQQHSVTTPCFYRELATSILSDTLVAGVKYYVEFYVSPSDKHTPFGIDSSDALGALFTNGEPDTSGTILACFPLPYTAQINNPNGFFIIDTLGWTKVSGTFIANGGEDHITLGNFKDTILPHGRGYSFIDDVLVVPDSTVNINLLNTDKEVSIYPNPFTDFIYLSFKGSEKLEIVLYDITSRKLIDRKFLNSTKIETAQLASGIYLYEVRNNNTLIKKGKIVKE